MAERRSRRQKQFLAERAGFRCEYCRTPVGLTPSPYSAEHIVPRSLGGASTADNLALSCQGCNGHKAAKAVAPDPATGLMVRLFNPRRENWREHFDWTEDGIRVEGKTAVGRATVIALQLNRPGLQNLRRLMVFAQIHPPEQIKD